MLDLDPAHAVTTPAEPAYCPTCELRHTRRPDWLCPRCGMPVESDVPAARRTARAPQTDPGYPLGSRIAGAFMVVTSGAIAAALVRGQAGDHRWVLVAAGVILCLLGTALLSKVGAARWIAAAIGVAVALVASEHLLRERLPDLVQDPLPAPVRERIGHLLGHLRPSRALASVGVAVGCLLMLVGRPGRARAVAGAVLAAPLVVLEILRAWGR